MIALPAGTRGGKPSRFGSPRPEWRGSGGSGSGGGSGGSSERDSRDGRAGRPQDSRGGYRPDAPRRESFQRPQGEARPAGPSHSRDRHPPRGTALRRPAPGSGTAA